MVDIVTEAILILAIAAFAVALISFGFVHLILRDIRLVDKSLDVVSVVQEFGRRSKRLEQELVDQKVRLEVMQLRLSKTYNAENMFLKQTRVDEGTLSYTPVDRGALRLDNGSNKNYGVTVPPDTTDESRTRMLSTRQVTRKKEGLLSDFVVNAKPNISTLDHAAGKTELEVLRMVVDGNGNMTAKEVQSRIRRSREHTARMMNFLYRQGLVDRDPTVRPFAYSITQKGREKLGS